MRTVRQPAAIIPATVFPLILLAINSVGLKSATSLPGFPTDSYVTFALAFAFIQARRVRRHRDRPEPRRGQPGRLLQPAAADAGSTPPRWSPASSPGRWRSASSRPRPTSRSACSPARTSRPASAGRSSWSPWPSPISLAFGSVGLAVGMRVDAPETVQSLFPLIFVFLFLSSMSLPRNLIQTDWFREVATYNPVSYMVEGLRSLLITGWDAEALALGFGCALGDPRARH